MATLSLDDIKSSLREFQKIVFEMKSNNVETYDSSLQIPFWRLSGGIKDYAENLDTTCMRFAVHKQLLENVNVVIDDQSINKKDIANVTKDLIAHVALYQNNVTKSKLGESLLQGLSQVESILKHYSRPDHSAGYTPGPGKR